jgi:hypothetical protein
MAAASTTRRCGLACRLFQRKIRPSERTGSHEDQVRRDLSLGQLSFGLKPCPIVSFGYQPGFEEIQNLLMLKGVFREEEEKAAVSTAYRSSPRNVDNRH